MYLGWRLWSKSKRIQKCLLLTVCITIIYLSLTHIARLFKPSNAISHLPKKLKIEFDLQNTPYRSLKHSHCILQEDGRWNCPDIRTQGTNVIRQVQLVAIRMLLIFDALCKKYGLRYWIKRGSLLGAVRHEGFIPWDTDLDIEMPIEDYLYFVRNAVKSLPTGIVLQHHEAEVKALRPLLLQNPHSKSKSVPNQLRHLYFSAIHPWNPRLRDTNSCYKYCLQMNCTWEDGILIDIYPVVLENGHYFDYHFDRPSTFTEKLWRFIFGYSGHKSYPLGLMKFEGFEVPVHNEWQQFLISTYGENYMDLPPLETRRLPSESSSIPDPLHACSELELDQSGNYVKRKSVK